MELYPQIKAQPSISKFLKNNQIICYLFQIYDKIKIG